MTVNSETQAVQAVAAPTITEADVARARVEGATAERIRIGAILCSEHAEGRYALARHLALRTDLAADVALGVLAESPKAAPAEPPKEVVVSIASAGSDFAQHMAQIRNPKVGADTEVAASGGEDEIEAAVKRILNA